MGKRTGARVQPPVAENLKVLLGWSRQIIEPASRNSLHRIYRDEKRFVVIYRFPIEVPAGRSLLPVVDMNHSLVPQPQILELPFDLTPAEGLLTRGIAKGSAPAELASQTRVSRTTDRPQLASVFSKTPTHRQPELVALLARAALAQ